MRLGVPSSSLGESFDFVVLQAAIRLGDKGVERGLPLSLSEERSCTSLCCYPRLGWKGETWSPVCFFGEGGR